jgi:hypothetical protein
VAPTIAKARPPEQGKEKMEVLVAARKVGRALLTAVEARVPPVGDGKKRAALMAPRRWEERPHRWSEPGTPWTR